MDLRPEQQHLARPIQYSHHTRPFEHNPRPWPIQPGHHLDRHQLNDATADHDSLAQLCRGRWSQRSHQVLILFLYDPDFSVTLDTGGSSAGDGSFQGGDGSSSSLAYLALLLLIVIPAGLILVAVAVGVTVLTFHKRRASRLVISESVNFWKEEFEDIKIFHHSCHLNTERNILHLPSPFE